MKNDSEQSYGLFFLGRFNILIPTEQLFNLFFTIKYTTFKLETHV